MYNLKNKEHGIDKLKDGIGTNQHAGDLHHSLYNEDYFIIYHSAAEKFLDNKVFDAIEIIREYETDNFGEMNTTITPEHVANMLAYIIGEEILGKSETLQNNWDKILNEEVIQAIIEELEEITQY